MISFERAVEQFLVSFTGGAALNGFLTNDPILSKFISKKQ